MLSPQALQSLSPLALQTLSGVAYTVLVLSTACSIGISCIGILSQAVRTSPSRSWARNYDALVIGASYVIVLMTSLLLCVKRRIAVRRKLQRISKSYQGIGNSDVPKAVRRYISQEYVRTCLVAFESLPKDAFHEGWGRPGTKYADVQFRRALLDTIPIIDTLARLVVPSLPPLKPHARMIHHFRHLLPLLPTDEDGLSFLHYYDSAIQLARLSSREPTESEFEVGISAAQEIRKSLNECRLEMLEESSAGHALDLLGYATKA